jgi:hypothetical protein
MCPDVVADETSRWNAMGPVNGKRAEITRIQHESCWSRSPGVGFDFSVSVGNLIGFSQEPDALGGLPDSCPAIAEKSGDARWISWHRAQGDGHGGSSPHSSISRSILLPERPRPDRPYPGRANLAESSAGAMVSTCRRPVPPTRRPGCGALTLTTRLTSPRRWKPPIGGSCCRSKPRKRSCAGWRGAATTRGAQNSSNDLVRSSIRPRH